LNYFLLFVKISHNTRHTCRKYIHQRLAGNTLEKVGNSKIQTVPLFASFRHQKS
jgi:hypothetical protein